MNVKVWIGLGAIAGLIAGLLLDRLLEIPTSYMRLTQVAMVIFGGVVAAFVYEGARAVTLGGEPNHSTDRPRRRFAFRASRRG
jgi:hypothetical protein